VAGSGDFDFVATGPCGIPAFEIGVDRSVGSGYQHPAWFTSPRRRGDDCFEILSLVHYLRSRHESRLLRRQIGCEVFVKLVSFFFERGMSAKKSDIACFVEVPARQLQDHAPAAPETRGRSFEP
jgi:hypothetical protein